MSAVPDLGAVFDQHVAAEFAEKDLDATMATMVEEPYVWHVPALTGAAGGEAVRNFYSSQFIGQTPAEHIYWDQASVLVQIGLLDPSALPVAGSEEAERLLELPAMGAGGG